jgi:hypothetical protein
LNALKKISFILFLWLALCAVRVTQAQQADTDTLVVVPLRKPISRPLKAALLSAVLPGAGQIYNKKYWKVPLVYGGITTFGILINFFNSNYEYYRTNLLYISDNNPDTQVDTYFTQFRDPQGGLRRGKDFYQRNRDYNIILLVLFYGLNIADAAVDAHMQGFDVTDKLTLRVRPTFLNESDMFATKGYTPGATLSLHFKTEKMKLPPTE